MRGSSRIVIVLATCWLAAGCEQPVDKMVGFCETELKDRLLSPASYKRVDVQTFVDPIPI
jgi:hypothetical protein